DSSGKAVAWRPRLARLFYNGKLVSDRRCRNGNPNRRDQKSQPLTFGGSLSRNNSRPTSFSLMLLVSLEPISILCMYQFVRRVSVLISPPLHQRIYLKYGKYRFDIMSIERCVWCMKDSHACLCWVFWPPGYEG